MEPVHERDPRPDGEHEPADGRDEVEAVPAEPARIGVDAAGHAEEAEDVHAEERHVEADEHRPEADPAPALAQEAPGHLRVPEVDGAEDWEHHGAVEHVVEVGDHVVAVVHLPVEGQDGQ